MKQTISTREAANILFNDEYAEFTYNGSNALAEYLEDLEEDTGEELEFNEVAIRCDFGEYESALEVAKQYTDNVSTEKEALEYLEDRTSVICFDSGIIIQYF